MNWIIINCNNLEESKHIGKSLLNDRLIACYDIIPQREASYFWPPRSGKIENIAGTMLIAVTVEEKFDLIESRVKKIHSDKIPFIGSLKFDRVNQDYLDWLNNELS